MKRADALAKLKWYIEEQNAGQVCAGQILNFVEGTLGLRPPRVSEEDAQAIMHVYYAGYTLNQWDEDIEKDEKVMEAKRRREAARIERSTPEGRALLRLRRAQRGMK
jgi:hypothetical protein